MPPLPFTKMHGLGNDYVVVDADRHPVADPYALARRLCDRRFGIGADGLLLVTAESGAASFRMRMFNTDGSEAEMCGNGLRCAARFAREAGMLPEATGNVAHTGAGLLAVHFGATPDDVEIEMGQASVSAAERLEIDGRSIELIPVTIGNPHAVIFVDDVEAAPVTTLGPLLETHPRFPDRTNVEFVEVQSAARVRQRTWERGCGETLACGTGACAVAAASVASGRTGETLEIDLRGGTLAVTVEAAGIRMRGPAVRVFEGTWQEPEQTDVV